MDQRNKILVLGLGNVLLQDEGIGVHVLQKLEKMGRNDGVDLLDGGTGGFVLLSLFREYNKLVIIDATLNDEPEGTIKVIRPKYARDFPKSLSTHELGLKDMIESAILLGHVPEIFLITVSINPQQAMSTSLSPRIRSQIPEVINTVQKIIDDLS